MIIRKGKRVDAQGIAHVHISSWQTTYRGIVTQEYLNNLDTIERVERWQRILSKGTSNTFIAKNDEGKIIGFIDGGSERTANYHYDGELYAIYLLEECQRQGVGQKLVYELVKTLKAQEYKKMLVWVLKDNPSRPFYESLRPEKVDEKTVTIGGNDLTEVAYGWPDLDKLSDRLRSVIK